MKALEYINLKTIWLVCVAMSIIHSKTQNIRHTPHDPFVPTAQTANSSSLATENSELNLIYDQAQSPIMVLPKSYVLYVIDHNQQSVVAKVLSQNLKQQTQSEILPRINRARDSKGGPGKYLQLIGGMIFTFLGLSFLVSKRAKNHKIRKSYQSIGHHEQMQ